MDILRNPTQTSTEQSAALGTQFFVMIQLLIKVAFSGKVLYCSLAVARGRNQYLKQRLFRVSFYIKWKQANTRQVSMSMLAGAVIVCKFLSRILYIVSPRVIARVAVHRQQSGENQYQLRPVGRVP